MCWGSMSSLACLLGHLSLVERFSKQLSPYSASQLKLWSTWLNIELVERLCQACSCVASMPKVTFSALLLTVASGCDHMGGLLQECYRAYLWSRSLTWSRDWMCSPNCRRLFPAQQASCRNSDTRFSTWASSWGSSSRWCWESIGTVLHLPFFDSNAQHD